MTKRSLSPGLRHEQVEPRGARRVRAWMTRGDGVAALAATDVAHSEPGPTEIVVRMRAATLNYRDLLVINGKAHWKPAVPRIPLSDGVGEVIAAGDAVTRARVGDRVAGLFLPHWFDGDLTSEKGTAPLGGAAVDGVLVEERVFGEQAVVRLPDYLDDVEAAALPVAALTAWHAVMRRSVIGAGETVLIQGTGGVSLAALQLVRALGARPIVLSRGQQKLTLARELGAEWTIDYREHSDWENEVLAATGGRGVDHVIEVVGGTNLNRSLAVLRESGTISFIGLLAGLSGPVDTYMFVRKNVRLHGIETGSREMFEEMLGFMEAHRIRPVIDRVFPFAEAARALAWLESGQHIGKVGIRFDASSR